LSLPVVVVVPEDVVAAEMKLVDKLEGWCLGRCLGIDDNYFLKNSVLRMINR
jgi:hypothetical protein